MVGFAIFWDLNGGNDLREAHDGNDGKNKIPKSLPANSSWGDFLKNRFCRHCCHRRAGFWGRWRAVGGGWKAALKGARGRVCVTDSSICLRMEQYRDGPAVSVQADCPGSLMPYLERMTARWFTDCAANGPTPIDPEFTELERASFDEILAFGLVPENRSKKLELMHCIDAAGTRVHEASTGLEAADIQPAMRVALAAGKGVRFWHNHPSQDSLSDCDWYVASCEAAPEVLALNGRGSFFVGRIVDWDDKLDALSDCLYLHAPRLKGFLYSIAVARGLDPAALAELPKFTGHVLNLGLADCAPVRYAYRLAPLDQDVIDRCSTHNIIADGRTFAAAALQACFRAPPTPKPRTSPPQGATPP